MNKILLIIQREYLTRVRKKSFIIITLLLPLLYALLIFGTAFISTQTRTSLNIVVSDRSGYFIAQDFDAFKSSNVHFTLWTDTTRDVVKTFKDSGYNGYTIIAPFNWTKGLNAEVKITQTRGEATNQTIRYQLDKAWEKVKNRQSGISDSMIARMQANKSNISVANVNDAAANGKIASTLGQISGFLIYFILLIYGGQVMMGVMEEKTNRIAEVIISSVKPFQLMMGKIIGIGMVALTQFMLWIGLVVIIYNVAKTGGNADSSAVGQMVGNMQETLGSINLPLIIFFFVIYFLSGFFFYASLYAAIGSAANEDIRDVQSISFPVTMLVIFSLMLMISASDDPNSPVAFWGSMIPISSPIVMMARIPYGVPSAVPWWQLGLSLFLLFASIVGVAWVSGRIYRTGILMYGKKVTIREMLRWVRRKQ